MPDAATEYQHLVAQFADHDGVKASRMFGSPCLKIHGKVFATSHQGFMVFKLPPAAHAKALALSGAVRWNPSGKSLLREWVAIPAEHAAQFPELAEAAAQFVGETA